MFLYEIIILAVIIALDLTSKYRIVSALGVTEHIQTKNDITFIKNFISFSYGENTGASFGIFKGKTTALIIVTAIALVVLIIYMFLNKEDNKFMRVCFIMILGGGFGNLFDRIFIGYVRDFIRFDFMKFPVFNVADSFITIGTVMLCIYIMFFASKGYEKTKNPETVSETANVSQQDTTVDNLKTENSEVVKTEFYDIIKEEDNDVKSFDNENVGSEKTNESVGSEKTNENVYLEKANENIGSEKTNENVNGKEN